MYQTPDEKEQAKKLRKQQINKKYYDKIKQDEVAYKQRLQYAKENAMKHKADKSNEPKTLLDLMKPHERAFFLKHY